MLGRTSSILLGALPFIFKTVETHISEPSVAKLEMLLPSKGLNPLSKILWFAGMYVIFSHYQLIGEWTCPDFSGTFKCESIKPLKRIGKLANRRNQGEVQSGLMAGEQKKYRRTWHTDLSFLFAGALLEGIKANLTFRGCSVCPLEFALPPKSSFQMNRAKMLLTEHEDGEQKEPELDTVSCSLTLRSCFQQCQVMLSVCLSFPQPPSLLNAACAQKVFCFVFLGNRILNDKFPYFGPCASGFFAIKDYKS